MSENEPKKETVRITLPQRPVVGETSVPPVKKETVRINLPARPSLGSNPATEAKKESSRISNLAKPPVLTPKPFAAPPAAPAGVRPPPPMAPRPPQTASVPPMAPRPPQPPAAPGVPRPPTAGAPVAPRPAAPPGAPVRPAVPPTAARPPVPAAPAAPVTPRPLGAPTASPVSAEGETEAPLAVKPTEKKNTARIELPPSRPAPQPTMKIQQTQPLVRIPEAQVRTSPGTQTTNFSTAEAAEDKTMVYFSGGVLLLAAIAFVLQLLTYLGN